MSNSADAKIEENKERAISLPDELPQELLKGRYEDIYGRFSDDFKKQVHLAEFTEAMQAFLKGAGSFEQVARMQLNGGDTRIWFTPDKAKGIAGIFNEQGDILGLQINGHPGWPEQDKKKTAVTYKLPFQGEDWLVFWGGTNVLLNYHYEYESQRYAYDIVQAKDGYSYSGDPTRNESYYAFGKEILAPADGVVVSIVNDIPDNEPVGVMNEKAPAGNVVVIQHGGEYSYLAHLKKGSVTVKPGDRVRAGDVIGHLGNSGNSSEPHLHFQVSDGAELFQSHAIPIQWAGGIEPVKGEFMPIK
ncbi:peptidoglycan DD-metalloendopeptidase family protein [Paenibacillus azoreducens]|uniref:peptidoglycan DD-metalloendopeptidase family protein n=1 Tax=Paenibacillus azoreducens TaxID=116718 RepID=UPI0039F4F325